MPSAATHELFRGFSYVAPVLIDNVKILIDWLPSAATHELFRGFSYVAPLLIDNVKIGTPPTIQVSEEQGSDLMNWSGCWTTYGRFKSWITDSNPHESLTLNRWFKFETAVGSSATYLKFIKFGVIQKFFQIAIFGIWIEGGRRLRWIFQPLILEITPLPHVILLLLLYIFKKINFVVLTFINLFWRWMPRPWCQNHQIRLIEGYPRRYK